MTNIIIITGASGSGKTTLGKKIKKKLKNVIVVETDDILDQSFVELYKKNKKFKSMIVNQKGNPQKIHDRLMLKKRDAIIKKNKDKTIIFVGMTLPMGKLKHRGYFINIPINILYKRKNLRELNSICSQKNKIAKLINKENPGVAELMAEFIYGIRSPFPIRYEEMKRFYNFLKKKSRKKGYKVMSADKILEDIVKYVKRQSGGGMSYRERYFQIKSELRF